ncbi:MAG: aminotransferase class IV [bacterium]|nr:aminotransferase class IV [bacterium]
MRELNCVDPWGYFAGSVHSGGRVVNWHELPVVRLLNDLGWLRSWSVFETMTAREEVVFHLNGYLERLISSMKTMHFQIPISVSDENFKGQIAEAVKEVLLRNKFRWRVCDQSLVKIIVTGGQTSDGFLPSGSSSVFIVTEKFKRLEFVDGKGLNLMCVDDKRPFPTIKTSGNYSGALSELKSREDENLYCDDVCDDIVYCDNDYDSRNILETSRANIFVVSCGKIATPKGGVLRGVTRAIVIKLAFSLGYSVEERDVSLLETSLADEVFVTSTTRGVWPVKRVGAVFFPVGPITLELREAFLDYEEEYYQK